MRGDVRGLLLVNKKSGFKYNLNGRPIYFGENDIPQYYFNSAMQIYSDKLSKFVCKANSLSNGLIIDRLCRIYSHIYIDEIQDLAGYDLGQHRRTLKRKGPAGRFHPAGHIYAIPSALQPH